MIGVIGGNGVAATWRLQQLVEEELTRRGAFRDAHHPEMLIWQATQAPSRSMYLEGRGESFLDDYISIGRKMKECGCDILCMCCNTAHYFIKELEEGIGLPFINVLDEVAKRANSLNVHKVGIICSDGLRKTEIYNNSFAKYAPDSEIVYPDSKTQEIVTRGICNAKNTARFTDRKNPNNPYFLFENVVEKMVGEDGCDAIVLGCTDINNVFNIILNRVHVIDSLQVIADSIISLTHSGDES